MKNKVGLIGGVTVAIIIVITVITLVFCTAKVPAGYVAVQYSMSGGVKDEILTQGWHIVPPTIKTTLYTIGIEQSYLTAGANGDSANDESFSASSSEGKAMQIDLTFTYQYKPEDVTDVFTKFKGQSGKEVKDSFIKPNIISWTKEVLAKYKVSDILGSERANVNAALSDYISKKFENYGISISNVSLINIEVDEETQKAINAKITAQQNAETQAINNQTAIDKANAEAQVKMTQAEAEAKANERIRESLTDEIIMQQYIEKWDGKLPQYMSGNEDKIMLGIGTAGIGTE